MRGPFSLGLCLSLCWVAAASADNLGSWVKGVRGSDAQLAEALLILGCIFSASSTCFLAAAWLQLAGKFVPRRWCGDFTRPIKHAVLVALWLPVVAIAAYLLSRHHIPSVAFLAVGVVFAAAHASTALAQVCWCCGGAGLLGPTMDNQKSALLNGAMRQRGGGSGDAGAGSPDAAAADSDAAAASSYPASRNPFYATYGLLPGSSSVFAYQIFIPGTEAEQQAAAAATAYTGLRSGPHLGRGRGDRGVRGPILQPLSPTQELSSQRFPSMAAARA